MLTAKSIRIVVKEAYKDVATEFADTPNADNWNKLNRMMFAWQQVWQMFDADLLKLLGDKSPSAWLPALSKKAGDAQP